MVPFKIVLHPSMTENMLLSNHDIRCSFFMSQREVYINTVLILHNNRKGSRLGHDTVIDGMLKDGLWDVYNDFGMGVCAELCADQHNITREEQVVFFSHLSG